MVEKRFRRAFAVSLASDILDIGPGMIPVLGDFMDAFTMIATRRDVPEISEQKESFLTLLEFVPLGDILPSHTVPVVAAYAKRTGKRFGEALADLAEPPTAKELIEMIPQPSEILPGELAKLPKLPKLPSPKELLRIAKEG